MLLRRKSRVVAAVTSALAGAAIGGGIAVANATPAPPPPAPPTVVDTPEPGDVTDAADTDNLQEGDQNGPEVPDTAAPPAPPPR
ncbi:MAG TPA: hypothetical protein VN888_07245 [Mycobacterium sp.]|nr:hypothetical protein [Mycobacterium sp.]